MKPNLLLCCRALSPIPCPNPTLQQLSAAAHSAEHSLLPGQREADLGEVTLLLPERSCSSVSGYSERSNLKNRIN